MRKIIFFILLLFVTNSGFCCEDYYLNEYESFDVTRIHLEETELKRVESIIETFHKENNEATNYKSYVGTALSYLERYEDLNGQQKALLWYELINPLVVKYSFENYGYSFRDVGGFVFQGAEGDIPGSLSISLVIKSNGEIMKGIMPSVPGREDAIETYFW